MSSSEPVSKKAKQQQHQDQEEASKISASRNETDNVNDNMDHEEDVDMKPLGRARPKTNFQASHASLQMAQNNNNKSSSSKMTSGVPSLQNICRGMICANLERFPPESMVLLDEDEWNSLIKLRHLKTKPKSGRGGLDGTGRMAPAINDKFLTEVEKVHPVARESEIADVLLWKDCVNHAFKSGGLTRPPCLEYPWPIQVQRIQEACSNLLHGENVEANLSLLEKCPINVSLLVATKAGKTLKKACKKQQEENIEALKDRVERLLESWKEVAQQEGVDIQTQPPKNKKATASSSSSVPSPSGVATGTIAAQSLTPEEIQDDWEMAESCQNWRQLFAALKQREETRRSRQGQRMRQIRKNLNTDRPKVVKVRPAATKKPQYERILMGTSSPPVGNSKMHQLKREAAVVTLRQNRGEQANAAAVARLAHKPAAGSLFARAVAGASGNKKAGKRKFSDGQQVVRTLPGSAQRGAAPVRGKYRK